MGLNRDNVVLYPRRKRRRAISSWFWLLLSSFFLAVLIVLYLASPLALVAGITVVGAERLSAEEILSVANLEPGMSLWRFSVSQCGDKLSAHPWIAEARVKRVFPNSLVVTVQERRAMAVLAGTEENWLVAGDGMVLGSYDGLSLPWLTGLDVGPLEPGALVREEAALCGLGWLEAMSFIDAQISEINVSAYPVSVMIFTNDGYQVYFAAADDCARRAADLHLLLGELRSQGQKGVIDFRTGKGKAVFKPWPDQEAEE